MRIVIFTDAYWPRVNGVTIAVDALVAALQAEGHAVLVVCHRYPKHMRPCDDDMIISEKEIVRFPSFPSGFSPEDRYSFCWGFPHIWARIDAFKPDIAHIQSEFSMGMFGRKYCKKRQLAFVSTAHTNWEEYARWYMPFLTVSASRVFARWYIRTMYRHDPLIIVPSHPIAQLFTSYGMARKLVVLPSGVDSSLFQRDTTTAVAYRAQLAKTWPRLATGPILLFVGRIVREKNLVFLLQVFERILRTHADATLLMVGDGAYRHDMERDARDLGIAQSCVFTGYVSHHALPNIYAFSDVFVFPSMTETQGLVTIESMLCATPVVAIGAMGTLEVMGGDNGGFMVQHDLEQFTRRVLDLLEDKALYALKSAEALAHGRACVAQNAMSRFLELYKSALIKGVRATLLDWHK